MPRVARKVVAGLTVRAQRTLGMSQEELGKELGASRRTFSRWVAKESRPSNAQLIQLARLVYPRDAALAGELAGVLDRTLEALGIVAPRPPSAPPPAPPEPALTELAPPELAPPEPAPVPPAPAPPPELLGNAVLCAAAEAMDLSPRALRPALLAAFVCARDLGLSVNAVAHALAATSAPTADAV